MASSPEQEIPQGVVKKAWEAGANRRYEFGDVSSLTFAAMTRALEATLPDLQRPLLEEIKRLKREGSPGVMHEVDRAFYDLTVKERDAERKEVDRLNGLLAAQGSSWRQKLASVEAERNAYIKELGEVNVERQRQEVRAIEAERECERLREDRLQAIYNVGAKAQQFETERDARPDLTDDEKRELLLYIDHFEGKPLPSGSDLTGRLNLRAKLERSLDAHKP